MIVEHIFNVILFSFIMIVPLIPIKFKISIFPFSADFVLSFVLIIIGLLCLFRIQNLREQLKKIFSLKYMKLITILMALFIVLSLFSVTYGINSTIVISETLRFAEYVSIFFLILLIVNEITIGRALRILYFTIVFACLFGIIQFVFNWSKFTSGGFFEKGRVFSTFVNPNYWGAVINFAIYYPIINILQRSKHNKILNGFSFILFFINLILCATKVSWVGFIIGLLVILGIHYRRQLWYIILLLVGILSSIIFRFKYLNKDYVNERLTLWKTGLLMFKDNFIKGVGNGNFIYNYHSYIRKYKLKEYGKPKLSVHNSFIKMYAELGIIGGSVFAFIYISILCLIYYIYSSSAKYKYIALSFTGGMSAYLFQNLFNNLTFVPQLNVFVFIISALLLKGLYIERQGE